MNTTPSRSSPATRKAAAGAPQDLTQRLGSLNLSLHKLEIFNVVVEAASVTRAAERLGLAQPAVSAHLRDLERRLGVTLVRRRGRNIVITEVGEHVHRWAKEVVTRSLELKRELQGFARGTEGTVVISCSMSVGTYVMPDLLCAYQVRMPGLRAVVRISNPQEAMQSVRSGVCDLAVLIRDPKQSSEGLVFERLWEEELVLVRAPDSKHVGRTVELAEVSHLPFISPPKGLVARDLEDGGLAAHGIVRDKVLLELGHPEAIKRAIRSDHGVGLLFRTAVQDELESGSLQEVRMRNLRITETLFLAYRHRKGFSSAQRRLLEFLRQASPRGIVADSASPNS